MDNYDELFTKDERDEIMMKFLNEIQRDFHELDNIVVQNWKDSEYYEKMDELRMKIEINIVIAKRFLKEKY